MKKINKLSEISFQLIMLRFKTTGFSLEKVMTVNDTSTGVNGVYIVLFSSC